MKKILLVVSLASALNAQNLQMTIGEVLSTNPIVLERLKNYNSTKEDITTAKAGYYPKLDLSLGAGTEHTDKTIANTTGNKSFDFSVYQNSLKYTQNIFKGWETNYRVEEQENRTIAAAYSYIEKVNDTSLEMATTYLQVMKNKELLKTAKENVDINNDILTKVKKLYDAGLTTFSEVNKIESSLALAKSNYVVQENNFLDFTYNLHRVLGRYLDVDDMSKPTVTIVLPTSAEEAAQFAMQNNPSLLVSKYNIKLAEATHGEKKSPFYPHLDIEVSQAMNKNLSAIEGEDNRFRAMAYLNYNFFNGFADTSSLQKSISQVHQEVESKNTLRRRVIEGLNLAWTSNKKLGEQLDHLNKYKEFSLKTLTLYTKEYDLGHRSLLDLLSAQNDYIAAKSQIINIDYSMLIAKYKILDAMGTLVSTVSADTNSLYSNVGLKGQAPRNNDLLPLFFDKDKDLVLDEEDICNNSLSTEMENIYGCELVYKNTQRIERYSGFLFTDASNNLTSEGEKRLSDLILQTKPYGFSNLKFNLLLNTDDENIKVISKQQAKKIKEKLIEAGVLEENIIFQVNKDKNKIFSQSNNVDILVRKQKI